MAVAFTTPMLFGTRVRPGERVSLELIVPNPSGGEGQYILPWTAMQDLCRPSLFDRKLQTAISSLDSLTPTAIRRAINAIASDGLAGHEVAQNAQQAAKRESAALTVTNYYLLLALVRAVTGSTTDYGPPTIASAAAVERAAQSAVARVGPTVGLDARGVALALEEIAATYSGIGLGPDAINQGRLTRTVQRLAALHAGLLGWIEKHGDDADSKAQLVLSCAALTLSCATATIASAKQLADRPVELLAQWRKSKETISRKVTRPEWIIDGWEDLCAIWEAASDKVQQRAAIAEIAQYAPVMPKEAADWLDKPEIEAESADLFRRLVSANHDWRSGDEVFISPARAEQLLANNLQQHL